jgi:hypothetical protein
MQLARVVVQELCTIGRLIVSAWVAPEVGAPWMAGILQGAGAREKDLRFGGVFKLLQRSLSGFVFSGRSYTFARSEQKWV